MRSSISRIAIVLVVLAALVYFLFPVFYTHVPPSRRIVSEALLVIRPVQDDIAAAALRRKSFQGVAAATIAPTSINTKAGKAAISIADDGKITVKGEKAEFTLELTPYFEGPSVLWRCRATPERDAPLSCTST